MLVVVQPRYLERLFVWVVLDLVIQLQAFDLSGGTFRDLAVDTSAGNALRIAGSFSANISGQVVSTSGGVVKISGETVVVVSGTGVRVSGETIVLTSGAGVRVSGETVVVTSGTGYVYQVNL